MPKGNREFGSRAAGYPGSKSSDYDKVSAVLNYDQKNKTLQGIDMDTAQDIEDHFRMHDSFPRPGDSLTDKHGSPDTNAGNY